MNFLRKVALGFWSIFFMVKYFLTNRYSKKKLACESEVCKLVVSLTSFPGRIKSLYFTIESIFNQSIDQYKVILYLSIENFPDKKIPCSLKRLQNRGLNIVFVSGDLKSYKKLHYAINNIDLKLQPLVTADDDIFYPRNWLETLYDAHKIYDRDIIYARGRKMLFDQNNFLLSYSELPQADGLKRSLDVIPTGVSGVLYPPNCFYKDVTNDKLFMTLSPNGDDLWYRIMTLLENRYCYLAFSKSVHFPPVLGSQAYSLRSINLETIGLNNDIQLKNILSHYDKSLSLLVRKTKPGSDLKPGSKTGGQNTC